MKIESVEKKLRRFGAKESYDQNDSSLLSDSLERSWQEIRKKVTITVGDLGHLKGPESFEKVEDMKRHSHSSADCISPDEFTDSSKKEESDDLQNF